MSRTFFSPPALLRNAGAVVAATAVLLAGAGLTANWMFTKQTPQGASASRNIQCWGTSSGGQVGCIREDGSVSFSGSVISNGLVVGAPEVGTVTFSGGVLRLGDARYVKKAGDTMTSALVVNVTGGNTNTIGLNVLNTLSGAVAHGEKALTSSGKIVWETSASGSALYVATSFDGVGLSDCALSTNALRWSNSTKRFSCGTISTSNDVTLAYATLTGATAVTGGTEQNFSKPNLILTGSTVNKGDHYHFAIGGVAANGGGSNAVTIRVKIGSSTLFDFPAVNPADGNPFHWRAVGDFKFNTAGGSVTEVVGNAEIFCVGTNCSGGGRVFQNITVVDLSANPKLLVSTQGNATAGNNSRLNFIQVYKDRISSGYAQ